MPNKGRHTGLEVHQVEFWSVVALDFEMKQGGGKSEQFFSSVDFYQPFVKLQIDSDSCKRQQVLIFTERLLSENY